MGSVLIKIKIMPKAPDVNLEEIKNSAKLVVEKNNGRNITFHEEPIAFGLKAIIVSFNIDEENALDPIEESLKKIEDVSSIQITDMRRAFG